MPFMYSADLYCDNCGQGLLDRHTAEGHEDTGDSDDFPQDVSHLDDTADLPQHCGGCGCFMENALTDEGREYVMELVREHFRTGRGRPEILNLWVDFYGISIADLIGGSNA